MKEQAISSAWSDDEARHPERRPTTSPNLPTRQIRRGRRHGHDPLNVPQNKIPHDHSEISAAVIVLVVSVVVVVVVIVVVVVLTIPDTICCSSSSGTCSIVASSLERRIQ